MRKVVVHMNLQANRAKCSFCLWKLFLAGVAVAILPGCGPIQTTSYIQQTKSELEAARTADAPELAPYEYTAAMAYLEKAREKNGYAEFAEGAQLGEKALQYARKAHIKAMETKEDGVLPKESRRRQVDHAPGTNGAASPQGVESSEGDEPRLPTQGSAAGKNS